MPDAQADEQIFVILFNWLHGSKPSGSLPSAMTQAKMLPTNLRHYTKRQENPTAHSNSNCRRSEG